MLRLGIGFLEWLIALFSGSLSWFRHFGSRKRNNAWHTGMLALEMQDYQGAKQQLVKAQGGNFNGLELMALARAEYALQDYDNALRHYQQACQLKSVRVAATCKLCEHYLATAQYSEIIPQIETLPDGEQLTVALIQSYAQVLMHLQQWQALKDKLPVWKRSLPKPCLLYTSPSPRDMRRSRMPSSA